MPYDDAVGGVERDVPGQQGGPEQHGGRGPEGAAKKERTETVAEKGVSHAGNLLQVTRRAMQAGRPRSAIRGP